MYRPTHPYAYKTQYKEKGLQRALRMQQSELPPLSEKEQLAMEVVKANASGMKLDEKDHRLTFKSTSPLKADQQVLWMAMTLLTMRHGLFKTDDHNVEMNGKYERPQFENFLRELADNSVNYGGSSRYLSKSL